MHGRAFTANHSKVCFDFYRPIDRRSRDSGFRHALLENAIVLRGFSNSSRRYARLVAQLLLLGATGVCLSSGDCQEVSFTPRYDGIPTPAPKKVKLTPAPMAVVSRAPQLYSLGRFNNLFQEACRLLEADGRRERVFTVSKAGAEDVRECPSCRALFRQFAQACAPKLQTGKSGERSPTASPEQAVAAANGARREEQATTEGTGLPPKRYPRTDLIDVLSRLSEGLYEFGPGDSPVFGALQGFERRLRAVDELTIGERDYYGIMLSYLFSAWAGRPGSPLERRTPSPEEIAELFR